MRTPALCLGVALLFTPGCKWVVKALLEAAAEESVRAESAAAGTEVSFNRSQGHLLPSGVKLNLTEPEIDPRGTSVGISVEKGRQTRYRMLPARVRVGSTTRVGDYLVTVPQEPVGEIGKLKILEQPPKVEAAGFAQSFTLSRDVARSLPDGTRLVYGMVGPAGALALVLERGDEWRWEDQLTVDTAMRFGDVLVAYRGRRSSDMVEPIAYRGGEQRSLVFGQPLRATALDTLVAPDGLTFRADRYETIRADLEGTATQAGFSASVRVLSQSPNTLLELGGLYRMNIQRGPEGVPSFELQIERVPDEVFSLGREFSLGPGQSAAGPDGLRIGHACTLEGTSDFHRVVLSHRSGHREERFGLGSAKDTLFALGPGLGVKVLGRSETGLRFLAGPSATLR